MTKPTTPLRQRMIEDMAIRNMSPLTQAAYVRAVANFAIHHGLSPDKLTFEDVRKYQVHLIGRGLKVATIILIMCALRFFCKAWRVDNAAHLSRGQRRVMTAIELCRTAALGGHVEHCDDCSHTRIAYNSCRNRHCPKCQWRAAEAWLAAREAELLPVPYFHVCSRCQPRSAPLPTRTRSGSTVSCSPRRRRR